MASGSASHAASPRLSAWLFLALALLAVATMVAMQQLRQGTDIVNTVKISKRRASLATNDSAVISFNLDRADREGGVAVVDSDEQVVKVLRRPRPMPARRYRFSWDGSTGNGLAADPGLYRILVTLGEQGREIEVPGVMKVPEVGR